MSAQAMNPLPTTQLRNIMLATDFSEASMNAMPYVTMIAKKLGSSVYLCHVVEPTTLVASAPEAAPMLYGAMRDQAHEQLKALAHSEDLKGFHPRTVVGNGLIGDALPGLINKNNVDLIVMGTHGRTGVRKFLLGSAVETVCRIATCPVLTVGPGLASRKQISFNRILVPTDLSDDSKRILPYVREIAAEYNSEITVLHVMPEELVSNPDAAKLAEPVRNTVIQTFKPELSGLKAEFLIEFGDPVETVLHIARNLKADMIAMGIQNPFIRGIQLRSSKVYRIMAGAHCPVLTYR